jgi:superfamily I DNA/RNA helicase
MKFMIAETFTKSLARLAHTAQALVKQAAFDFQLHPAHPGFHFHRLERARDKQLWSFRVTDDLRIIVHRTPETFTLCYTDHHDAAYAWAERRRLEIHPITGAAQLVDIQEVVRYVVTPVAGEPSLFATYDPEYLLALGVPQTWLDAVRTVGESGFAELLDHLPQEAAERLFDLACGRPVPRPVAEAPQDPFTHPDAQRRFRVLDDQHELRRALAAPWEQWVVFLHPTQRSAVERSYNGPARVTGSAGTGKTVVALHRAAHLVRTNPAARVLLTTFSRTLAARLAQYADVLLGADTSARQHLAIAHLHRVALTLWSAQTGQAFAVLTSQELLGLLETAVRMTGTAPFPLAFLRSEWEAMIDAQALTTWEAYQRASRAGRGTPLGVKQRLVLWRVFAQVLETMHAQGRLTWNRLCHETAAFLEPEVHKPYDHVIADECQDFGPAELRLLRALVPPGPNDVLLCGDAGQRIYKAPCSWLAAGINVRGRSTRLRVNYRTTEQIQHFADAVLPSSLDQGDGTPEARDTIALLSGPVPQVRGAATIVAEISAVRTWLTTVHTMGYQPADIAIFARTERVLRERAEAALRACGMGWHYLSDDAPPAKDTVSLGTLHRAKGLEFKVVVVLGCDADLLPLAVALQECVDEVDRQVVTAQERHLLYVACTRAREQLLLTYAGAPSVFVTRSNSRSALL